MTVTDVLCQIWGSWASRVAVLASSKQCLDSG